MWELADKDIKNYNCMPYFKNLRVTEEIKTFQLDFYSCKLQCCEEYAEWVNCGLDTEKEGFVNLKAQ